MSSYDQRKVDGRRASRFYRGHLKCSCCCCLCTFSQQTHSGPESCIARSPGSL
jgi:hypothetical protein